ncbi:archease [uncultured Mycobacterium sp.]|uniref:archease n=1 Tax=uncultured Mycobacterium sp. TaxID=171292 RepID=UPI0035CB3D77
MIAPDRGHRTLPHPADITIEAWAPTREACLAEAVMGLTESFVDVSDAAPLRTITSELGATNDSDRLVVALDELIYLLDTQGVVPLSADIDIASETMWLTMPVASINDVTPIGAVPKAVALSGLEFGRTGDQWRCRATIDV